MPVPPHGLSDVRFDLTQRKHRGELYRNPSLLGEEPAFAALPSSKGILPALSCDKIAAMEYAMQRPCSSLIVLAIVGFAVSCSSREAAPPEEPPAG